MGQRWWLRRRSTTARRSRRWPLLATLLLIGPSQGARILVNEPFDDASIAKRGWYDNVSPVISARERHGGNGALEMAFLVGKTTPVHGSALRHLFPPTDRVYLRYWVKYSSNWIGSKVAYHPHEFYFLTDLDPPYLGPAASHLTTYIEHHYATGGGVPRLAMQDALNIDTTRIGVDLTSITEARAVAGCNGSLPRPVEDCYRTGDVWANGKAWSAAGPAFIMTPGRGYQGDWHKVEAYFQLNSIANGKGIADGVVQYWFDGTLLIDHQDMILRTAVHPAMRFNQFLIGPYIGVGSPVAQTMWVDDLVIATGRVP